MRILVYGAGAVGGYFGARLALGGHDVTFVARGENLAALRRQGLTVRLPTGEALRVVPAKAVGDPTEASPAELVLITVKSYDTPAAAAALRPVVGPETALLSLQNGIENEDILARLLGLPPLIVALTRIGVELVEPAAVA
ncbi:MAG TPA: 2-dehydropantoate 2-reductase N-terminal domain-containing protein, partial [Candidatus Nitrosopolaris sp.]|nr:2-dehydropantoate 2-reductase N-terminal domain-containing protein [Candidatus Nitrosopolaris sp.]